MRLSDFTLSTADRFDRAVRDSPVLTLGPARGAMIDPLADDGEMNAVSAAFVSVGANDGLLSVDTSRFS